ncbi:PLDc_N domain-containing protein [Puniceicoccus vermicola]|uniref:PLDc_N domain-containing protein n=2 Tax=Puniceicoccus vermicola TaxID=388746 RepID=A0A7X1B185_9BACT|nr:PLDc_N domain-containing protein [Puniceicoccus vermicola]
MIALIDISLSELLGPDKVRSFLIPFICIGFLVEIAWLWCLIAHLKSEDMNPTDKICWTIVLCVLNWFGMILYILLAPESKNENAKISPQISYSSDSSPVSSLRR